MSLSTDEKLNGLRKAAILLVTLDTDSAATLMSHLDVESVEKLTLAIARLENVNSYDQDDVIEEFLNLGVARQYLERGGIKYATELLERSLSSDQAKRIIQQVQMSLLSTPFAFLKNASSESLVTFLADEHPQTIALVLAHLLPRLSSELLESLPASKQLEVTRRIAKMEQTSPEVIREVEIALQQKLSAVLNQDLQQVGGANSVAEILNYIDRASERGIMESLEAEDPDLVEKIKRLMFTFDDVQLVDQRGIQEVLKEVQNDTLALALKGASEQMREKFFSAMSDCAASIIKENMEYLGPVRVSDVEKAQQEIVDVVRRLADTGTITLQERGGSEQLIN